MRSIKIILALLFVAGSLAAGPVFCEETNKVLMIDDFDKMTMFNLLGGKTQGYEEAGVKCIPTFTEDPNERHGDKGASLRLDFDVNKKQSFSYYWTTLIIEKKTEVEGKDIEIASFCPLREYDTLEFWFKDPQGGIDFVIELHEDVNGDGVYTMGIDRISTVDVGQYIDKSAVGKWQKISIPLANFSNIKDWDRILDIVFVFKNGYGIPKGTVYLDDLALVKRPTLIEPGQ